MASIKAKLLRNLGANAYGQLVTIVIQFASIPLFLHYWGVELYGEWLILSAIPAYLSLSDAGFSSVAGNDMTIRVAKGDKRGAYEVYQSTWVFVCAISALIGFALALAIYFSPLNEILKIESLNNEQTRNVILVLIIYVLVGLQISVLSAAYRATGRYAYGAVINHTIRWAEWFGSVAVLVSGGEVIEVALAMLAVRLVGTLIMWAILRRWERWLRLGFEAATLVRIRKLMKPAFAFMAFPLGLALTLQGMVLVIGMTLGSVSVVIFTVYRTLTRFVVQMSTMLNQAVWPEMSAAFGAGNKELLKKLHRKASSMSFWFAIFSLILLASLGEWVVDVWTGHSIDKNKMLFVLLLIVALFNVLWQTSWVMLMATNKHNVLSITFMASAAVGVIVSLIFIPFVGINGAGFVLVLCELPLLYMANAQALRLLGDDWRSYGKFILSIPVRNQGARV